MVQAKRHIKIFDKNRNEIIQCYLRFGLILIVLVSFGVLESLGSPVDDQTVYAFVGGYLVCVICYFLLVKIRPTLFVTGRILLFMQVDIVATAYVMYLAGSISVVFVPAFLWYIIGYGMRFGLNFALIGTLGTTIAWLTLAFFSPYWSVRPTHVFAWLITFLLIPGYYFLLVQRLHASLRELDIALRKTERLANRDSLTRLANRNHFNQQAEDLASKKVQLAILLIDLDGFKSVNDEFGHKVGDQVLVDIARVLKECCPAGSLIARLGGDEFIIAVRDGSAESVGILAERILQQIVQATSGAGRVTASIGISFCPGDADNLSQAKSLADKAMYQAKKMGKNRYSLHQAGVETDTPQLVATPSVVHE